MRLEGKRAPEYLREQMVEEVPFHLIATVEQLADYIEELEGWVLELESEYTEPQEEH